MRRTLQTLLYAASLAAAAVGAYAVSERVADELETRTGAAVRGALSEAGITWAWVEIDGMQATLRGPAQDEAARFRALAAASEVLNPTNLRDEMSIAVPVRRPGSLLRIEMLRNGDSLLMHGVAPQDGVPALGHLDPGSAPREIVDLVARSSDPAPENWAAATELAAETVGRLRTVRVIVTPGTLAVEGIAPDHETAKALEALLDESRNDGLATSLTLQLPRPVLSPFVTRFVLDDASARLATCAAESDAGRALILQAAAAAGAEPSEGCPTALGAPDPGWSRMVAEGIGLVAVLGSGTVTFSDLSVTLSLPPDARTDPEFETRLARFEASLPEIYTLSVIEGDGGEATGSLRFTATRSPEGLVNMRGPVGPLDAREIVQTLAAARFGSSRLHAALRGGSGLPEAWPVQVMAAIDALSHLDSGVVTLTPDMLALRGISGAPGAEATIARALDAAVGADLAYALDVAYAERLDPQVETQGPSPQDCVSQINALLEQNDVSFPPGSVDIDESGLETVAAIADILYECPDVEMEIGGHTDSQGSEEMNQLLSQARADAVLNALIAREVLVGGLTSRGYGETEPIADNASAEGREANRRIRFSLVGPDGAVVPAASAAGALPAAGTDPDTDLGEDIERDG